MKQIKGMMARDRIGNSLKAAKRVKLDTEDIRFRDAISQTKDQDDLYRIRLRSRSTVNLVLSNQQRSGNADVEVYGLTRKHRSILKDIGRTDFSQLRRRDIRKNLARLGRSRKTGKQNEVLSFDLDPSIYYVRVHPKKGTTRYRLTLSPTPIPNESSPPIAQPFITVTSPNGGEALTAGEALTITWEDSVNEQVTIDLFSNGMFVRSITEATPSNGQYRWNLSTDLAEEDNYTIRISSTVNSAVFDASDASFSITGISPPQPFNIQLDYRFDTQGWFTPERKATLEHAADIWEAIIQDDFENVPAGTALYVENPQTATMEEFDSDVEIDDLIIFVGMRNSENLGEGGPSALYFPDSNLANRFTGSDFEPWTGSIYFGDNGDWFFDATPETADDIPTDHFDFLSVAIHEIGHTLGFGTARAFDALVTETRFVGEQAIAANGGAAIPLAADLSHIEDGYEFGGSGELMFDPTLDPGARTLPTRLDAAMLADIGYSIDYDKTFQNA